MEASAEIVNFGWMSLLPSLVAIGLAFATRQVFFSLFIGIWVGAVIMNGGDLAAIGTGLLNVIDTYLIRAVTPEDGSIDHMSVAMFTLVVGGMIGIISANGGMAGIVQWLTRYANNRKKGQLAAFAMGFLVFFDDYANTLIVGKTLRPLTDKLKISRQKLAFIVDATAAPLACIALITTWIGFQLSLVSDAMTPLGLDITAYEVFLSSIPYSFYPILMLVFIAVMIASGRDYGPMLQAEQLAQTQPALEDETSSDGEFKAINAMLPIVVLILSTAGGLYMTGSGDNIQDILGSADPFKSMLWASLLSLLSAVVITLWNRALSAEQTVAAMEEGFKPMMVAVMILTFAWAIAGVNKDLQTAEYIVSLLSDSLAAQWIPAIVFIMAAITAFATGSSWGTMAILIPLVVPLSFSAMQMAGVVDTGHYYILYAAIASIMAGAVWGDHCSPISDTTILSSLASDCPHMEHVQTQMPYALVVALITLIFGVIPSGFGVPAWVCLLAGSGAIIFFLRYFGKTV